MAGKQGAKAVVDPFAEPEELDAVQTGAPEVIDAEMNNVEQMMNDVAGITQGEIMYWLHRATEKNKNLHGNFLKRYPKDTPFIDIWEEARDAYKGGNFVLVAQKDGRMFKKAAFTCEVPEVPEKAKEPVPEDPFDRLSRGLEKMMIVGKVTEAINGPRTEPVAKGIDPTVTILTSMLTGMQMQNLEMLKLLMANRSAPEKGTSGNDALMDAIKLGVSISGGKLPFEDGEGGGLVELLKPLIPHIPAVIAALTGKGPALAANRPVLTRPGMVVPGRPLLPPAGSPQVPPPGMIVEAEAAGLPILTAPSPVEEAGAMVMRRIVDEVKFILTLPVTPKLREHLIDYIEAYRPDILEQAEAATPELFAAYVITLDPAFEGRESFFIDLHKQYMAGIEEPAPPVLSDMGIDPLV